MADERKAMRTGDLLVRVVLDLAELLQRGGKSAEWAGAALAALRQPEPDPPPLLGVEHELPAREPRVAWRSWFS